MRVALCISGDFKPTSNVIAAAAQHILPDETIDVFASLWTPVEANEQRVRSWIESQLNPRMRLCRWTSEPVRALGNWTKFTAKMQPQVQNYVNDMERLEYSLQLVNQLKDEQECIDGQDYDAVVRLECHINLVQAPRLAKFHSVLKDHIILGQPNPMPWWPAYDFRVALMSSRNMDTYSAIQTLHRRQYLMRYNTIQFEQAFVNHMHHARMKTICVPVTYTGC